MYPRAVRVAVHSVPPRCLPRRARLARYVVAGRLNTRSRWSPTDFGTYAEPRVTLAEESTMLGLQRRFTVAVVTVIAALALPGQARTILPPATRHVGAPMSPRPQRQRHDQKAELYVVNAGSQSVAVYQTGNGGNVAPLRVIAGKATLLIGPTGIALDARRRIYVSKYKPLRVGTKEQRDRFCRRRHRRCCADPEHLRYENQSCPLPRYRRRPWRRYVRCERGCPGPGWRQRHGLRLGCYRERHAGSYDLGQ